MSASAIRRPSASRRWLVTGEAWLTLVDEVARLRRDVAILAGASLPDDGIVHLPVFAAAMGRTPGDRVEVIAPAGPRVITVLSVE